MIALEDKNKLGCNVSADALSDLESIEENVDYEIDDSKDETDKVEKLLSFSKLLCTNLQNLKRSRAALLRRTESISRQLEKECVSLWNASTQSADRIQQNSTCSSEDSESENESIIDEDFQRCRGGVDLPEGTDKSCAGKWMCACNLCRLRPNNIGKLPPCESDNETANNPYCDFECLNTIAENIYDDPSAPAHIRRVCKMQKLKESLEHVKNRNRNLRKLLDQCGCVVKQSASTEESVGTLFIREDEESEITRNIREELLIVLKDLQRKCRMKDGMIALLADELKRGVTYEQATRILRDLAQPNLSKCARDFDRTTLWRYLTKDESEHLMTVAQNVKQKAILICAAFSLIIILFAFFRFRSCFGIKIAFSCESTLKCISDILWKLYKLLTSCEIIIKIPSCICKQIFLIIPFVLTIINEYVLQYLYNTLSTY